MIVIDQPLWQNGPFAGYPRVFGVTWAFVAHADSRFDVDMLHAPILLAELGPQSC